MTLKKAIPGAFVLLMLFYLLSFNTSCKKNDVIEVKDTIINAWTPLAAFNNHADMSLNGGNIGGGYFAAASDFVRINFNTGKGDFDNYEIFPFRHTYMPNPTICIPYMDSFCCTYSNDQGLLIETTDRSNYTNLVYKPTFDKVNNDAVFPMKGRAPNQCSPAATYPALNGRYVLMPIEKTKVGPKSARFDLVKFDLQSQKLESQPVHLAYTPESLRLGWDDYFCATYFGKFFVYYDNGFFRIDTLGNVKSFGPRPTPDYITNSTVYNMFTYEHTLFINADGLFYYSTDEGETWEVFGKFSENGVSYLKFKNVGDKLYATWRDQLFSVAIKDRKLVIAEINNSGLENKTITSLVSCGRYFFTTTMWGVYYRDSSLVNEKKNPL